MTRQEHLQWAKKRALEYVNAGDLVNAYSSITRDLSEHADLANHSGIQLGMTLLMSGLLDSPEKMRNFIEGFN